MGILTYFAADAREAFTMSENLREHPHRFRLLLARGEPLMRRPGRPLAAASGPRRLLLERVDAKDAARRV